MSLVRKKIPEVKQASQTQVPATSAVVKTPATPNGATTASSTGLGLLGGYSDSSEGDDSS